MTGSPTSIDEPDPGPRAYRAFNLNADGRVGESRAIQAQSDDEAKAIAATMPNGHGIDLWERARYLASYPLKALHIRRASPRVVASLARESLERRRPGFVANPQPDLVLRVSRSRTVVRWHDRGRAHEKSKKRVPYFSQQLRTGLYARGTCPARLSHRFHYVATMTPLNSLMIRLD